MYLFAIFNVLMLTVRNCTDGPWILEDQCTQIFVLPRSLASQ
jgi:hypothetical protein